MWKEGRSTWGMSVEIAILVVHHTKKTTEVAIDPVEKILGSIGIAVTLETILILEKKPGTQNRNLFVTGKDVEQADYHLTWNEAGYDFHENAVEAALGPKQEEMLSYIKNYPHCKQADMIRDLKQTQSRVSRLDTSMLGVQSKHLVDGI